MCQFSRKESFLSDDFPVKAYLQRVTQPARICQGNRYLKEHIRWVPLYVHVQGKYNLTSTGWGFIQQRSSYSQGACWLSKEINKYKRLEI